MSASKLAAAALCLLGGGTIDAFLNPSPSSSFATFERRGATFQSGDRKAFQRSDRLTSRPSSAVDLIEAALGEDKEVSDTAGEAAPADDSSSATYKLELCDVPPASFEVTTVDDGGPSKSGPVHTLTINLGQPGHPAPIVIETGKIGRQASGAVTLTRGDSVLYATAARDKDTRDLDFLPLSVDHQERFSSAGLTSGAFNKRDGRPAEHEILVCRLIDRPLRPLIADGWRHETQLLSWVLSYDGERTCDPLAITASAAALWLSDVPLKKPVAAAMVGYVDGQLVMNPTLEQMEHSRLHLIVAGTEDAVLMIEGAADFLPEDLMVEAVSFGHEAIKLQCAALKELAKVAGKEKKYDTIKTPPEGIQAAVDEAYAADVDKLYSGSLTKKELSTAQSELSKRVTEEMEEVFPEETAAVKSAYKDLMCRRIFQLGKTEGVRIDGRRLDEVRPIDSEAGLLPRVHGSALFTRGETQTVATATLGDSGMKQKIDKISGMMEKRFYLQYTFPPSCVGETGRVGAPGRREVGHGNLAERGKFAITLDFCFGFILPRNSRHLVFSAHPDAAHRDGLPLHNTRRVACDRVQRVFVDGVGLRRLPCSNGCRRSHQKPRGGHCHGHASRGQERCF